MGWKIISTGDTMVPCPLYLVVISHVYSFTTGQNTLGETWGNTHKV